RPSLPRKSLSRSSLLRPDISRRRIAVLPLAVCTSMSVVPRLTASLSSSQRTSLHVATGSSPTAVTVSPFASPAYDAAVPGGGSPTSRQELLLFVRPQAMRRFRPNHTPGAPAQPAPATSSSGPVNWYSYQFDGSMNAWCGSLPSTPLPVPERS